MDQQGQDRGQVAQLIQRKPTFTPRAPSARARFLRVAGEGWPFVSLVLIAGCVCAYLLGPLWLLPFLVLIAGLSAFFHDRKRPVPPGSLAVTAPVDGSVVHRRECYDPFLDREAIRLTFDVAFLGTYLFRSPVAGTVLELPASACPDFAGPVSWIRTNNGDEVVMTVSEGIMFGTPPCQAPFGERVGQGRPCGQRRLAQQLDLYLPKNSRVEVIQDDQVRAGMDIIARFVRKGDGNDDAPEV